MSLTVRVSWVMSLPVSGTRRDRSVPEISRAASDRSRRGEQPPTLPRREPGDEQDREQRDHRVGAQQVVEALVLVGEEGGDHEGGVLLVTDDGLHGDQHLAVRRVDAP
ncbi:hypothetical protein [Nocardioides daphniae]|uniref:hypothetical protein n=1 Tax=Nocardioides daphniae TaxID=402297 RepID=UPI001EE8E7D6|nr:hypothetical protein [Nocardioides daphniae]